MKRNEILLSITFFVAQINHLTYAREVKSGTCRVYQSDATNMHKLFDKKDDSFTLPEAIGNRISPTRNSITRYNLLRSRFTRFVYKAIGKNKARNRKVQKEIQKKIGQKIKNLKRNRKKNRTKNRKPQKN